MVSIACQKFLDSNQRAQLQWKLEEQFAVFEKSFNSCSAAISAARRRASAGPASKTQALQR